MVEVSAIWTILILTFGFGVNFVPRIPMIASLGMHCIIAVGIYFGCSQVLFNLPAADSLPISSLFGGSIGGGFNSLSFGVVYFVVALCGWVFAGIMRAALGNKEEQASE